MLRSVVVPLLASTFLATHSTIAATHVARDGRDSVHRAVTARDVVLASAEAIGGVDRLRAVRAVRVEEVGGEYLVSTITRRDAPPRLITQTLATLRSSADGVLRRTSVQMVPMRTGRFTVTTVVNRGVAAVVRGPGLVAGASFDLTTANEELSLSPERVLLTALDAPDLRLDRDTTLGGVPHHVVSLGFDGAVARVFIDAASAFPTHLELVRAYPGYVFWAMWGDLRFTTTWSSWSRERSGVWYPRQRSVTLNGEPFRDLVVTALDLDGDVAADSVAIPDSVRSAFTTPTGLERAAIARGGSPTLSAVELADGVVLYQGGYQSAAVRQHDGVVIIEAPESNAKSRAVLADVATRWPGARVKAVINTSPMWMHVGGLREYAARGIPIYVADAGASVVRGILAAPHRQAPDSLSRVRLTPTVRVVSRMLTIGTGDERLELRPARGQHASTMMLVWVPARRLLYASDVVIPDAFEPVFAAAYRGELVRLVQREGLDVERVFSEHLPATPWAELAR